MGHCTNNAPQGPFAECPNLNQRLNYIQEIITSFWKRWTREVFPNLVFEPKWHPEKRDVKVNNVVMLQDPNLVRGEWTLGVVDKIIDINDGREQNFMVRYRNGNTNMRMRRAV